MKKLYFMYVGFYLFAILPSLSHAHKVSIFAWVEGDTVFTQSKFMGGKKTKHAAVSVYDKDGTKLLQGATDADGFFSFKAPVKAQMKVVLDAGMGHRNEWTILSNEFLTPDDGGKNQDTSDLTHTASIQEEGKHFRDSILTEQHKITRKELQDIVEKALDKKLHPLTAKINQYIKEDDEPNITEILGAVGYIIGLVGLGAYMNYKKK